MDSDPQSDAADDSYEDRDEPAPALPGWTIIAALVTVVATLFITQYYWYRARHERAVADLKSLGTRIEATAGTLTSAPEVQTVQFGPETTDSALLLLRLLSYDRRPAVLLGGSQIGDAGLEHLSVVRGIGTLDLSGTRITDAGLQYVARLDALEKLDLSQTEITDAGLRQLVGLDQLVELNLSGTAVTDASLDLLKQMSSLRRLRVNNTELSAVGIERLMQQRPALEIVANSKSQLVAPK